MSSSPDKCWIQLHPSDNVACLLHSLKENETFSLGDRQVTLDRDLGLGHKIALRDIEVGEKILKFGFPIGSATLHIRAGAHVHVHNMKSDYLPTYTLDQGATYGR